MSGITGFKQASGTDDLSIIAVSDNISYQTSNEAVLKMLGVVENTPLRLSDLLDYILAYVAQNKMTTGKNLNGVTSTAPDGIGIVFDSGAPMTH